MKKEQDVIVPEFKFVLTEDLVRACAIKTFDGSVFNPADWYPNRAEDRATGWDVRCAEPDGLELTPGFYFKIRLGIHMLAPEGWWLELRPRSSSFAKRYLHALYGVIDENFPGELIFACQYIPNSSDTICRNNLPRVEFGDRIGQVIPVKRQNMIVSGCTLQELEEEHARRNSNRTGGLGSTGIK